MTRPVLTLRLDAATHERLRRQALDQRTTVSRLVRDALATPVVAEQSSVEGVSAEFERGARAMLQWVEQRSRDGVRDVLLDERDRRERER